MTPLPSRVPQSPRRLLSGIVLVVMIFVIPVAVARDDRRTADVVIPVLPEPNSKSDNAWTPPIPVGLKSERQTAPLPPLATVDIAIASKEPPIPPAPPILATNWSMPTGGPELLPAPTITPRTLPREPAFVLGDPRLRHWEELHCVAWSPDGKTLAGGGGSRGLAVVRLWDPVKQTEQEVLRVETEPSKDAHGVVVSLVFAADGKRLAGRCDTGDVCLWTLANGRSTLCAKLVGDCSSPVSFSPDGKTLAVGCANDRVQLWEVDRQKPTVCDVLKGGKGTINELTFSRDGKDLKAHYDDGTAHAWNLVDGSVKLLLPEPAGAMRDVFKSTFAFSPEGKRSAAVRSGTRTIELAEGFDPSSNITALPSIKNIDRFTHPTAVVSAVPLMEPDSFLSIDLNGNLSTWVKSANDLPSSKAQRYAPSDTRWIVPQGPDLLLFLDPDKHLNIRDLSDRGGKDVVVDYDDKETKRSGRRPVTFTKERSLLALGNFDGTVHIWGTGWTAPKKRCVLKYHKQPVTAATFIGEGETLVTGDDEGTVCVWPICKEGSLPEVHKAGPGRVLGFVRSETPGLRFVVAELGKIQLWEFGVAPAIGKIREVTLEKGDWVPNQALVVSPDGETIAAREAQNLVTVWDATSGKRLGAWHFSGPVHDIAFSRDSRSLITANGNGTASIYRLDSEVPTQTVESTEPPLAKN